MIMTILIMNIAEYINRNATELKISSIAKSKCSDKLIVDYLSFRSFSSPSFYMPIALK